MALKSRPSRTLMLSLLLITPWLQAQVSVTTAQYNNLRTGSNQSETQLTPANVTPNTFGLLFSRAVDDSVYASPLYVPHVTIGSKIHNVVYVATIATLFTLSMPMTQRSPRPYGKGRSVPDSR